jgi:putative IMPACT (imprinted ancient) family translation regulator
VVVIRYFGGTLLGVPGLINAYKEATKEALSVAEIETKTINSLVKISYDFDQTNALMQMVRKLELTVKEQTYENRCGIILDVRNSYIEKIKEELKEYWSLEIEIL